MSDLKDAQKMEKMAEELKDILEFDDYGIYEKDDFNIKKDDDSDIYEINLKIRDMEFEFHTRFALPDDVRLDEDDSNEIEINTYEDNWDDIVTYNWTAKKLILMLLFDAVSRIQK